MGRWMIVILVGLSIIGTILPVAAAPPPGFPPDPPGRDGGTPPAPPRSNPGTPAELTISDTAVAEGAGAVLTVTASAPPTGDITVDFATADGSATVVDSDYAADTGTVVIPAGQTTVNIDVTTIQDGTFEVDETFQVMLSNPSANATIVDGTGVVTLLNDDDEPSTGLSELRIEDVTVDEDHFLLIRVFADPVPASPVTVDWTTVDGTAMAGQDYTAESGTLTINAQAMVGGIAIGKHRDDDLEDPETLTIVLSNPSSNATIVDDTGVVTIVEGFCGTVLGIPVLEFGAQPFNDLTCQTPEADRYHIHPNDPAAGDEVPANQRIVAFVTSDAGATDLGMGLAFEPSDPSGGDAVVVVAEPVLDGAGAQIGLELDFTTPSPGLVTLQPLPDGASEVLYHLDVSFPPPPA